jgi:hypothetical protein
MEGRLIHRSIASFGSALVVGVLLGLLGAHAQAAPRIYLDFKTGPIGPGQVPASWNGYTLDDAFNQRPLALKDDVGQASGITFQFMKPSPLASAGTQNAGFPAAWVPIGPPDVNPFSENLDLQQAGEALKLTGLAPGQPYDFWLLTYAYRASFLQPMRLAVSGVSGLSEVVTPEDTFLSINGVATDNQHTFDSYRTRIVAGAQGQMTIQTDGGQFVGVFGLAIQPVPEPSTVAVLACATAVLCAYRGGRARR